MRALLLRKGVEFFDRAAEWSWLAHEPDWRKRCWSFADKLWSLEKAASHV